MGCDAVGFGVLLGLGFAWIGFCVLLPAPSLSLTLGFVVGTSRCLAGTPMFWWLGHAGCGFGVVVWRCFFLGLTPTCALWVLLRLRGSGTFGCLNRLFLCCCFFAPFFLVWLGLAFACAPCFFFGLGWSPTPGAEVDYNVISFSFHSMWLLHAGHNQGTNKQAKHNVSASLVHMVL